MSLFMQSLLSIFYGLAISILAYRIFFSFNNYLSLTGLSLLYSAQSIKLIFIILSLSICLYIEMPAKELILAFCITTLLQIINLIIQLKKIR